MISLAGTRCNVPHLDLANESRGMQLYLISDNNETNNLTGVAGLIINQSSFNLENGIKRIMYIFKSKIYIFLFQHI